MTDPQPYASATGPSADAEDSLVIALARAVERAVRRVEALDTAVAQLAADVTVLARALDARTRAPAGQQHAGDGPGVRSWLLADDPEQAVADLADLAVWMDAVYLRYRDAFIPSCWLWHPEAVEELWWLRQAHADAYHPETGSWLRVGDWHDRQRPAVARRVARAVGGCELALHVTDPSTLAQLPGAMVAGQVEPPAPAPITDAVARVAAAWAADGSAPEPTGAQLAESQRYGQSPWSRR